MFIKVLFAILVVATIVVGYFAVPEMQVVWNFAKKRWLEIVLASTAVIGVLFALHSYQLQNKFTPAQIKPLIDCRPFALVFGRGKGGNEFGRTEISIINYSGFLAKEIGIDVKYGTAEWIGQWVLADQARQGKQKEKTGEQGQKAPEVFYTYALSLTELKPGKAVTKPVTGALNSNEVCEKGENGMPVKVRMIWQNEVGHIFDEVKEFRLVCTKSGEGRSFTFLPGAAFSE